MILSPRRSGLALAAATAVLVLAGCANSLDVDDLESKLASQAAPEVGAAEADVEVSCPDDIDAEEGTKFDCEAAFKGKDATIAVELTDDEGTYVARLK